MNKGLAQQVVVATGLPQDAVNREFNQLMSHHGTTAEELTIEQLREIVADYLNTVFLELAEDNSKSA